MDVRYVAGAIVAVVMWLSQCQVRFTMAGRPFVFPVLVLVAFLLALVLLALLAFIVRELLDGGLGVRSGT